MRAACGNREGEEEKKGAAAQVRDAHTVAQQAAGRTKLRYYTKSEVSASSQQFIRSAAGALGADLVQPCTLGKQSSVACGSILSTIL
jgi:hypothetical protein